MPDDQNITRCKSCGYPCTASSFPESSVPARMSIPWEQAEKFGVLESLFFTCKEILLSPGVFFAGLRTAKKPVMAWIFALIAGGVAGMISYVWNSLPGGEWLAAEYLPDNLFPPDNLSAIYLIFSPLLVSAEVGLLSIYFHFLLFIFRAKNRSIHKTFTILCYAQISSLAVLVPGAGDFISGIWFAVLCILGFHKVHNISKLRAAAIIFLPLLVLILFLAVFFALLAVFGIVAGDLLKEFISVYR
ncbi:MAG: hypothetical protein GF350_02035 [Chitinivibrionales bacterium]|nr:hypothetical protein [Chitinivibrionales bacterium]